MAYATVQDVQASMSHQMSEAEQSQCSALLDRAAIYIDAANADASDAIKKEVSIRVVTRCINTDSDIPMGATQGSMAALGYSQSWTSSDGVAQIYFDKTEKKLLGIGNKIGASDPLTYLEGSV